MKKMMLCLRHRCRSLIDCKMKTWPIFNVMMVPTWRQYRAGSDNFCVYSTMTEKYKWPLGTVGIKTQEKLFDSSVILRNGLLFHQDNMEPVLSSRLCVNGHIQTVSLLNTYIVSLMALRFITYLRLNIYFFEFCGLFLYDILSLLLGSDTLNELALCVHYLFPYVFLIYALGHKVEVDWKKMLKICTKEQC